MIFTVFNFLLCQFTSCIFTNNEIIQFCTDAAKYCPPLASAMASASPLFKVGNVPVNKNVCPAKITIGNMLFLLILQLQPYLFQFFQHCNIFLVAERNDIRYLLL